MGTANGQLSPEYLVYVGKSYGGADAHLGDLTAPAWFAMQQACALATGVILEISPNGGYRTLAQQQLELPNGGASVGFSTHGERRGSVDIWNWAAAWGWLQERSDDFGFVRDVSGENWHHHQVGGFTSTASVAPNDESESDVFGLIENNDQPGTVMLVRPDGDWVHVRTGEHLGILLRHKAMFRHPGLSADKWAQWAQETVKAYLTGKIVLRAGRYELETYPK